jgi:hypothetical protein
MLEIASHFVPRVRNDNAFFKSEGEVKEAGL